MQISQNEIERLKSYISGRVAFAKYYAQGVWTRIEINKIDVLSDGRIDIYILFDNNTPGQIDKIEFYNPENEIFATGSDTINKEAIDEDILYRYTIVFSQSVK